MPGEDAGQRRGEQLAGPAWDARGGQASWAAGPALRLRGGLWGGGVRCPSLPRAAQTPMDCRVVEVTGRALRASYTVVCGFLCAVTSAFGMGPV